MHLKLVTSWQLLITVTDAVSHLCFGYLCGYLMKRARFCQHLKVARKIVNVFSEYILTQKLT